MSEYYFVEKPCIDELVKLGYQWINPDNDNLLRDGLKNVILKNIFISQLQKINNISEDDARAVYYELLKTQNNEEWTKILRGNYSRTVLGESKKKTIRLIDFTDTKNNVFSLINQFYVKGLKNRIPDIVLFVNGIPLVVIEAKSPLSLKDKTGEAFEQIKQYERDIPILFYTNLFNIITDGNNLLYGATGSSSEFWGYWRDPWPKKPQDFENSLAQDLYALCAPERLLDILAHFVVFEKNEATKKIIKKVCRYHQYRAANKIYERIKTGIYNKGLIWHTQGSGKSLTMVYTVLKLKAYLSSKNSEIANPNILVLTDRVNLDKQISNTFKACDIPNPKQITSKHDLTHELNRDTYGLVLLSTIFKFEGSASSIRNSRNWIVLIDECHRTQEKDLGAYLRKTLPDAKFFGFTGTPVKNNDHNTYQMFSEINEGYLDKYSIDHAVRDGATVPIKYTNRLTKWQVNPQKLDILFDQWFGREPEEKTKLLKNKGASMEHLVKHPKRLKFIAKDIWTHFLENIQPNGLKAQIVAIDREAVILYKLKLDKVITEHYITQGLSRNDALEKAKQMSKCVYSNSQEDAKPSEDSYTQKIRDCLQEFYLDQTQEADIIRDFNNPDHPLSFLIVCNKLLTGFDAKIEGVMYLDNPLKEHNLLQAIARTNRLYNKNKQYGLIVDYIGITKNLEGAFETYNKDDVANAMQDIEVERAVLKGTHLELQKYFKLANKSSNITLQKSEFDNLIDNITSEDEWYAFKNKAKQFTRAYEAMRADPIILNFQYDFKWIIGFLCYATQKFEQKTYDDIKNYNEKIRLMLEKHLDVIGITSICKIHTITDPEFWNDFNTENKTEDQIKTAAIHKGTELKKILTEKVLENKFQYDKFSQRVQEIILKFNQGHLEAAEVLKKYEQLSKELQKEENDYLNSGLTKESYGILKILEACSENGLNYDNLLNLSTQIAEIYSLSEDATIGWQDKDGLKKSLRQKVRERLINNNINHSSLKNIVFEIENYAIKHYSKVL